MDWRFFTCYGLDILIFKRKKEKKKKKKQMIWKDKQTKIKCSECWKKKINKN